MICTIGLVLGFRSASNLAAAYGVAVTATMAITTLLFEVVARRLWGWRLGVVLPLAAFFLVIDHRIPPNRVVELGMQVRL